MRTQEQESQEGQVSGKKDKRKGQGRRAKEEHMPPLQEIPPQKVPSHRARQMHMEQEI